MRELPEGWCEAQLPEIAEIVMGQSPPSTTYNVMGDGLPFFQGKAEFQQYYPLARKYCTSVVKLAAKDDVLISVRAPVGPTNLAPSRCGIGRGLAAAHPLAEIPSRYVLYWFRNIELWLAAQGTGSTFTAISRADLNAITVSLAPLCEQRRIVAKLDALLTRVKRKRLPSAAGQNSKTSRSFSSVCSCRCVFGAAYGGLA